MVEITLGCFLFMCAFYDLEQYSMRIEITLELTKFFDRKKARPNKNMCTQYSVPIKIIEFF